MYNSTIELVQHGRAAGLDWTAVIGTSGRAAGEPQDVEGVDEIRWEPSGVKGIIALSRALLSTESANQADLLISMVPQTDMALGLSNKRWVAFLRGRPWPGRGEASAIKSALWRRIERVALSRAAEVWATTPMLAAEVGDVVSRIVPPGIARPLQPDVSNAPRTDIVWAARFDTDKNPRLFQDMMTGVASNGVMFGTGPLEDEMRRMAPANVEVAGWVRRENVWDRAYVYVGTSFREAFGRSAVEAAMQGIPVIVSDTFGCAEMLFTDTALSDLLVLPVSDVARWRVAVDLLISDRDFYSRASAHVKENAAKLAIGASVTAVNEASKRVAEGAHR